MKNVVSLALIALLIVGCDDRDKSKHETQQSQPEQTQNTTSLMMPLVAGAVVGALISNGGATCLSSDDL